MIGAFIAGASLGGLCVYVVMRGPMGELEADLSNTKRTLDEVFRELRRVRGEVSND